MTLIQVYRTLYDSYGPQGWWPADSPFEIMIGAILTQNTAWSNVEKAINNLKGNNALSPDSIINTPHQQLAEWLLPSGYYNIKSERLKQFCHWYIKNGELEALNKLATKPLRESLLQVKGIGPETADDILLYAFRRPVFVIDAYTRRLFLRLQLITGEEPYEKLRQYFESELSDNDNIDKLFNEYHALIVMHAKQHCKKQPDCADCPLRSNCEVGSRLSDA